MTETPLVLAHRLVVEAMDAVRAAAGSATDDELISLLAVCEGTVRQLDRITVDAVAGLERRGAFAERGYKSSVAAVADLLGWERFEARRRVVAAEQVTPRVGLDGAALPARLPATAAVFAAGRASLRHVDAVARVLGSASAARLTPQQWAEVEGQLAAKADSYTPSELQNWGESLVELLDQDGPEPDDRPPGADQRAAPHATPVRRRQDQGPVRRRRDVRRDRHGDRRARAAADGRRRPVGGATAGRSLGRRLWIRPRPRRRPRVRRTPPARQCADPARRPAEPRPRRLPRLRPNRLARGTADARLRRRGGADRAQRGRAAAGRGPRDPHGLRRAVAARDKGCAHPGCDRPPSWSEVHHVHEWELGGETTLSNLVMLCRVHHRQIHFTEWIVRIRNGLPEFVPPKWIDRTQTPRRKALSQLVAAQ